MGDYFSDSEKLRHQMIKSIVMTSNNIYYATLLRINNMTRKFKFFVKADLQVPAKEKKNYLSYLPV